jgi:hypothetical protein
MAPPPPAYVPPPGYPPAPPPGYSYAAPPGYAYPPPAVYAPLPRPPRRKRPLLVLPQVGVHSFQNQDAAAYDPGLRFGAIVGGRFGDWLSLDGEMTVDVSNVRAPAPGDSVREWAFDLSICSLFQLPAGPLELLLGPKAGYYQVHNETRRMGVTGTLRGTGFSVGINTGVFLPVSPATSVGVLLSFELRMNERVCEKTTGIEVCTSASDATAAKVIGVSGAALF